MSEVYWHALPADGALARLRSSRQGLTFADAAGRLARHGPNRLRAARPVSAWRLLADQFRGPVVLLLFGAAMVALALGDRVEALAIGAVLAINTALGFATELRARRAMEALLHFEVARARVVREGQTHGIEAAELVPGDVLKMEAGDAVPADLRLLSASELRAREAALTGESLPVDKLADAVVPPDTPLADRLNLLHKGTTVVAGAGLGVVVATGMDTEIGRIGQLVDVIPEEPAPLERRLDALGRRLVWITAAVAIVVALVGALRGNSLDAMVPTAVALAIAAVPEGLPAVATIALAVGLHRMARRNALVRRLAAVESLGSTTVVCTDKTGTLTAGEMVATRLFVGGRDIRVSGSGFAPVGEFREGGKLLDPGADCALHLALRAAVLASRSELAQHEGAWRVSGDPTDGALVVAGEKAGLRREPLLAHQPEVADLPFSSERRLLASFHRAGEELCVYVKGAPSSVLDLCSRSLTSTGQDALDETARARLAARNAELASEGLRVLGLAYGTVRETGESALRDLLFLGFAGLSDPPAAEVKETIERFRGAGIRTVMITGDQRPTAEAIGRELGISDVFSRVSPAEKLTIVDDLQRRGEIVAMLGDGVNDAAALKKADVGVAMGVRGTDVAKETADIVLQDDRFATVAAAVEEGRVIFENIRRFIFYLFSCNLAEVLVLFLAGVAGLPLPLLPLQILWLNLVTDTFPALALAVEPAGAGVMQRPPRDPDAAILSRAFVRAISFYAALITLSTLVAFVWGLSRGTGADRAVTLTFMTLALAQLFHLGTARSEDDVLAPERIVRNRYALAAVGVVLVLQLAAVYWPPLARLLQVQPLAAHEWAVVAPLAALPAIVGQTLHRSRRHRARPMRLSLRES